MICFRQSIWKIQMTKILFPLFVVFLLLDIYLFSSGNINAFICFALCGIIFFALGTIVHYFYIGLDHNKILFHNPFLFSWKKVYHYDNILKVRIWYPLDSWQIIGFKVYTHHGSFNYYSVGLVSISDCQNIVDFLLNHNISVEIINFDKNVEL